VVQRRRKNAASVNSHLVTDASVVVVCWVHRLDQSVEVALFVSNSRSRSTKSCLVRPKTLLSTRSMHSESLYVALHDSSLDMNAETISVLIPLVLPVKFPHQAGFFNIFVK
jgi:hypothetical protein